MPRVMSVFVELAFVQVFLSMFVGHRRIVAVMRQTSFAHTQAALCMHCVAPRVL